MAQNAPVLAVDPVTFTYDRFHEQQLAARLAEVDRRTVVSPVTRPEEVSLTGGGCTEAGGLRYTTVALTQLCHLLAPGLSQLVFDVAEPTLRDSSQRLAIDYVNRLILLRFDRVRNRQLVRNAQAGTIDGIVGPKYRYLSNLEFHRQASAARTELPKRFQEALLYGRDLVMRYLQPERRLVVIAHGTAAGYTPGLHYVNSEIGHASVRAAPLLCREDSGETCTGPFTGRLSHAGRDFDRKLGELTHSVEDRIEKSEVYRAKLRGLMEQSLGLGGADVKLERRAREQIVEKLRSRGVSVSLAEAVLRRGLVYGANGEEANEILLDQQKVILQRRTAYDVFGALTHEARPLHIHAREAAEQVAYALLMGKFHFSGRQQ